VKGLSVQIGRQRFRDDREWLFDDQLDALRVFYQRGDVLLDLSVSRKGIGDQDLLNDGDEEEMINNYLLYATYTRRRRLKIAVYALARDDQSSRQNDPIFLGLHSSGQIVNDLDYWVDVAHVRGRDQSTTIHGFGFDVGLTYEFDLPWKPSLTVAHAFGTGDPDPTDGVDESFRQTGFQDNADRFNGVTRFKYYGEALDPELSNLAIVTAGIGIRPTRRSSLDLVYHHYVQDEPTRRIRDAEIDRRPAGRNREVGDEIDLIAGYREIQNLDMEVTLGYFMPGRAFREGSDDAFFANVKLQYSF
jgi:alginate production protein